MRFQPRLSSSVYSNHSKAGNKKKIGEVKENKPLFPSFPFYPACSYPHISVFLSFHPVYILISQILSVPLLPKKKKNKMDKYIILSPEAKGSFNDRLNFLYLKLGNFLDTEKLENRTLQYCKVFSATPRTR